MGLGQPVAGSPGTAAEVLEDLEVMGSGMNDPGVGPADQLADEGKDLVVG